MPEPERLLTPREVAQILRVDPRTTVRWANQGLIDSIKTLGGHRRYRESDIQAILRGEQPKGGPR